jgi:Na+/melibiose symporter-like transporter
MILAAEGVFALTLPLVIGPLSDATATPWGRRRPYLLIAVPPMAIAVALLGSLPSLAVTTAALMIFYFGNYVYEPPWRGLYADLLPPGVAGRAQGASHVLRGVAMAGALVGGGIALAAWQPLPFLIGGLVTATACLLVPLLVHEPPSRRRSGRRLRDGLKVPLRIIRRDRAVRRFLVVNTAWEITFAGMRTFVVLYVTEGLGQPLYVSSAVLALVTLGYVVAAGLLGPFADRVGLGRALFWASLAYGLGLLIPAFATTWHSWYYAVVGMVALAGGSVMTLAWGLLFKLMPDHDQGATSSLAIVTRGIGLLAGPPIVGLTIDLSESTLAATHGYAAMWVVVALPVLLVTPLLRGLADDENGART